jgi:hypothetical protein
MVFEDSWELRPLVVARVFPAIVAGLYRGFGSGLCLLGAVFCRLACVSGWFELVLNLPRCVSKVPGNVLKVLGCVIGVDGFVGVIWEDMKSSASRVSR